MTTSSSTSNASPSPAQKATIVLDEQAGVAAIFLTEKHLQNAFVTPFIAVADSVPSAFSLIFVIDGYHDDPRSIWQIPDVRYFLRRVALHAPQLLTRFTVEQRHHFRLCFRDVSHVHGDGATGKKTIYYAMDPRWQDIANAAGIDPEVLA